MIRTYIKIAFRHLAKQLTYSIINIGGLAIGIASSLVILVYAFNELSYEKHFENHDRILRVATKFMSMGEFANGPVALFEVWPQQYDWIESTTRVDALGSVEFETDKLQAKEEGLAVEENFFEMFDYPFVSGDRATALDLENSIVISQELANTYFGDDDPIGKSIILGEEKRELIVTGVVDYQALNSHLNAKYWARQKQEPIDPDDLHWFSVNVFNYVMVTEDITTEEVQFSLNRLVENEVFSRFGSTLTFEQWFERDDAYRLMAQPLDDIYLKGVLSFDLTVGGNATAVYVLLAIAVLISVIAAVNFINLTTAKATKRAREVGVKKVMGSTRAGLSIQFLSESILISLMAMVVAFGLSELFLVIFQQITGQVLISSVLNNISNILLGLSLAVLIGFLAGLYPSFYLSAFRPSQVLKGGTLNVSGSKGFRNVLVVFQFTLSVSLIVCSLLISKQLEYMRDKDLGFGQEDVLVIRNAHHLGDDIQGFKQKIAQRAEVVELSLSSRLPGSQSSFSMGSVESKHVEEALRVNRFGGDFNYVKTIGYDIIAGRDFDENIASDSNAVILNETAARELGLENPIGEILNNKFNVIGVVRDFNFEALKETVGPVLIHLSTSGRQIAIKFKSTAASSLIAFVEDEWNSYSLEAPVSYSFLDQNFEELMAKEKTLSKVVSLFTVLAVVISCLGLFGLSAYVTMQRRKEIGIRKLLGASAENIVTMLNKEFTILVALGIILAIPIAWYMMNLWLADFAYKTDISAWVFVLAGAAALMVALLTVSYQSLMAAMSAPVDAIREE